MMSCNINCPLSPYTLSKCASFEDVESRVEWALVSGTRKVGPVLLVILYDLLAERFVVGGFLGSLGGDFTGN